VSDAPSPDAPAKKPNWALRIILGFLAGCLVLFLGGAFLIYRWVKSPENQERFGAIGEVMKVTLDSATAPGTSELRALGCKTAVVMDGRTLQKVSESVVKIADPKKQREEIAEEIPQQLVSVVCNVGLGSDIECTAVAKAYAAAVDNEPERFMVLVQGSGFSQDQQKCLGMYSGDGELLENLEQDRP
jgi:hypothetical protein